MSYLSSEIVAAVLAELNGRMGFDDWWDDIDKDIKDEITQKLITTVDDTIGRMK